MIDGNQRAGAGAVIFATNEGRRQPALQIDADAGIGQDVVRPAAVVGQGFKKRREIVTTTGIDPGLETRG